MLTNFYKYLTAFLCITNVVHADYWRFTLNNYECIEPREWETDHVYFRMDMITTGPDGSVKQNQTTNRGKSSLVPRGAKSDDKVMWKDITLDDGDRDLVFTFTAWNRGDDDPQKVGLEIAQLVLKVLRGNLAVSIIASAISFVLDLFKDAYDCHGPVMLNSIPYSKNDLLNMQYGQPICTSRPYTYSTQGGCRDDEPFNLAPKQSKYVAQDCVEKFPGSSSGNGEVDLGKSGSAGKLVEPPRRLFGLATVVFLTLLRLGLV